MLSSSGNLKKPLPGWEIWNALVLIFAPEHKLVLFLEQMLVECNRILLSSTQKCFAVEGGKFTTTKRR
ncbi:hypothetical protein Mic7113_1332 [Allocoleopsis franciscana PCC 7113]|uniref:Uncharacterized protein n=1 Tax=Allocoleopsis franciscana PCC 7113 TaxID=1173027 RepID=K9WCH1_9CYAN|nr:hypothetical protein Mic7113_1332 [Allocoleopsis franciscana PCC 7113]